MAAEESHWSVKYTPRATKKTKKVYKKILQYFSIACYNLRVACYYYSHIIINSTDTQF